MMADRVLVFSSDPGRVKSEIPVAMTHPRDTQSATFKQIVDQVYSIMMEHPQRAAGVAAEPLSLGYRLPDASPHKLTALVEALVEPPLHGRADLPLLADNLALPDDALLQLLEAGRILGFVKVETGDAILLPAGHAFAAADGAERKSLFAAQLLHHISLASHIRRVLDERRDHRAPENRFLQELEDYLTDDEAERVLEQVISWGRYGEIFDYDYNSGVLSLPEEAQEEAPPADSAAAE